MPGKPYTLREMKQIVQYLIEHNAYGEIRGRKMWIEFASSRTIDRTWQSLKETFLKRILPDIHNPYYKLTGKQISSFRQGYDVTSKNKLDVHRIREFSSNAENNDKNQPCSSKNNEQNDTGEDLKCSKIQKCTRSSTDSFVLENCNENAEDVNRDHDVSMKSLRDCIIYTEPLTPMLQESLHDFDIDDDKPKIQIVKRKSGSTDIRQSRSYDKLPRKVCSIYTIDTLLNNQEGLLYYEANDKRQDTVQLENKEDKKKSRKRQHSRTSSERKKKLKKKENKKAVDEKDQANDNKGTVSTEHTGNNGENNDENQESILESNVNEQSNSKTGDFSLNEKTIDKDNKSNHKTETRSSTGSDVPEIISSEINPCLENFSLFAEQFSTLQYSDSDGNDNQSNMKEVTATVHLGADKHKNKDKASSSQISESTSKEDNNAITIADVIVVKSNLEPDPIAQHVPAKDSALSANKSREKILSSLFGLSSSRGSRVRKRGYYDKLKLNRFLQRRRTNSIKSSSSRVIELASGDEFTTTESDTETSSLRKPRNRFLDRHIKPDPLDILSHGEMSLVVASRKKIYPLMLKEGKSLCNATAVNSDSDEVESHWKSKYLEQTTKLTEEKLRVNELKKLIEITKQLLEESKRSPIIQANPAPSQLNKAEQIQEFQPNNANGSEISAVKRETEQNIFNIKFTTRDKEIEFKGSLSQMEPMLEKMVQILNMSDDAKSNKPASDTSNKFKDSKTDDGSCLAESLSNKSN